MRISPFKLVGYVGEGATFIASPTDSSDRTIQGVKFDWESSDSQKLQIDEAGRATFLQPGRVWITCRTSLRQIPGPGRMRRLDISAKQICLLRTSTRTSLREARILLRTESNNSLEDFSEWQANVGSMGTSFPVTDFARAVRYRTTAIGARQF